METLEYQHYDHTGKYTCDYTDDMRDQMLKDFEPYIKTVSLHHVL
jgi:hypothetical protein